MSEVQYGEAVQDGELYKFEKEGQIIEGLLKSYMQRPDTGKGIGNVYELKNKDGVVAFFAPTLLHKKLKERVGQIVKITFTKTSKTKIGNTLKEFEVLPAPATPDNLKALGISEAEDKVDTLENF